MQAIFNKNPIKSFFTYTANHKRIHYSEMSHLLRYRLFVVFIYDFLVCA